MKKFGLIGYPIAHSLSPALFKAAYGGRYTYDLIEEDDFGKAYGRFLDDYDAINVTAPFKELAFIKADTHENGCKAIGAANIMTKSGKDKLIWAYNSDVLGVTGALKDAGIECDSRCKALIVGCGGAGMAAAYAMWHILGFDTTIINRNLAKVQKFVNRLTTDEDNYRVRAAGLESFGELFRDADVIVYTLPVAIPALKELSRRDLRGGRFWRKVRRKVILEANYKDPALTNEIIDIMHGVNPEITFISGKEWLLHQAVGAYRIFTGEEPDIESMRKVIE